MQRVQQIWITGVSEFGSSSGCLMKKDPKYPVTPTMSHIFSVSVHNPWKTRLKPLIMYLNHKCVLHFDHRQYSYVPWVVTGASDVNLFDIFFFFPVANKQQRRLGTQEDWLHRNCQKKKKKMALRTQCDSSKAALWKPLFLMACAALHQFSADSAAAVCAEFKVQNRSTRITLLAQVHCEWQEESSPRSVPCSLCIWSCFPAPGLLICSAP